MPHDRLHSSSPGHESGPPTTKTSDNPATTGEISNQQTGPLDTMQWLPAQQRLDLVQRTAQRYGNSGIRRLLATVQPGLLQRQPAPASATATPADELTAAEQWVSQGVRGPTDVTPGNSGGFEATYDPQRGELHIVMRVGVEFKNGLAVSGATITPGVPALQDAADRARALRGARRTALIAQYQWPAVGSPQRQQWVNAMKTSVEGAWSQRYEFHIGKPQWDWIGARVNVDIHAHDKDAPATGAGTGGGATAGRDHLALTTVKMPANENMYTHGDFSSTDSHTGNNAFDQTMLVSSNDVTARQDGNFLRTDAQGNFIRSVLFDTGSATLDAQGQQSLNDFIATFNGSAGTTNAAAGHPAHVRLEAHSSMSGTAARNTELGQQRAEAVRQYLADHNFRNVDSRVATDNRGSSEAHSNARSEQRVDLIVDGGERQVLINHEFGHAFGLDDEYPNTASGSQFGSPSGGNIGARTSHDAQTQAMTDDNGQHLPGSVYEVNGNIMSAGNTVLPQHYSTFHTALVQIAPPPAGADWSLGAPHPKPLPGGGVPAPDTPLTPPTSLPA